MVVRSRLAVDLIVLRSWVQRSQEVVASPNAEQMRSVPACEFFFYICNINTLLIFTIMMTNKFELLKIY